MVSNKLFVSNLDFDLTEDELRKMFSEIGEVVSLTLVMDREKNRSKGYCFVEMADPEQAAKAIELLNGKVISGRPISVAEDKGKKAKGAGQREHLQPMQRVLFFHKKKRKDPFIANPELSIDYKDAALLAKFTSERGRILPRRLTGLSAYNQRRVAKAIKRARILGLLPFTTTQK